MAQDLRGNPWATLMDLGSGRASAVQVLPALRLGVLAGQLAPSNLDQIVQVERPDSGRPVQRPRRQLGTVRAEGQPSHYELVSALRPSSMV